MTDETEGSVALLVLMDGARDYYLIPRESLERSRATTEEQAAIERALSGNAVGSLLEATEHGTGQLAPAPSLYAPVGVVLLPVSVLETWLRHDHQTVNPESVQGGNAP